MQLRKTIKRDIDQNLDINNMENVEQVLQERELTTELIQSLNKPELELVAVELFEYTKTQAKSIKKADLIKELCSKLESERESSKTPLTQEEIYEHNRKTVERFVRNEDNQKSAISIALNIRNAFGREWFTVSDLHRAFLHSRENQRNQITQEYPPTEAVELIKQLPDLKTLEEVKAQLETLTLFNLVRKDIHPKGKKPTKYKITTAIINRSIQRQANLEKSLKAEEV